jgi:hypothetical protein
MSLCAAEAQVRMRHPGWGIVAPDGFIRTDSDPLFRGAVGLRGQARDDRLGLFYERRSPVELVVPLPVAIFEMPHSSTACVSGCPRTQRRAS